MSILYEKFYVKELIRVVSLVIEQGKFSLIYSSTLHTCVIKSYVFIESRLSHAIPWCIVPVTLKVFFSLFHFIIQSLVALFTNVDEIFHHFALVLHKPFARLSKHNSHTYSIIEYNTNGSIILFKWF